MTRRAGVTLVELLVILAILALATGLSSIALRRIDAPRAAGSAEQLRALRREAIRTGLTRTSVVRDSAETRTVTVLPDGRTHAGAAMRPDSTPGARHADAP